MRVLFVSTHLPFPPIDGVRIPAANHLLALRMEHEVDCLLLKCETMRYSDSDVDATRQEVDNLYEVYMRPMGTKRSLLREFFKREPFYGRWVFAEDLPSELLGDNYDMIWCGTAPAVAVMAKSINRLQFSTKRYVAGLSDIHSLVIKSDLLGASKSRSFKYRYIRSAVLRLRGLFLKRAEKQMLHQYELITMQSQKEKEWVGSMDKGLDGRVLLLPNGVDNDLFSLSLHRSEPHVFFVGLLSGMYRERLMWFFENAWPLIKKRCPDVKATVVGKGASVDLISFFQTNGVEYVPFVDDLKCIYAHRTVMVAPIFKGYGIINKVLEAMASGCLVVGDKTAFNGIDGFQDRVHGLVAETAEEFSEKVCQCLESDDYLKDVRSHGRELICSQFSWTTRYKALQARVRSLVEPDV